MDEFDLTLTRKKIKCLKFSRISCIEYEENGSSGYYDIYPAAIMTTNDPGRLNISRPDMKLNGVMELNDAILRLGEYSSESNLALNESKTKWMLVSTRQKFRAHALQDHYPLISCNGTLLERVTTAKIY